MARRSATASKKKGPSKPQRKAPKRATKSTAPKRRSFENIRKDPIDLRDVLYEPSLDELPFAVDNRDHVPHLLDQGREGACTGFGLAAVVNFLLDNRSSDRRSNGRAEAAPVSARMLYEMAKRYDEWAGEDYDGSSIRGAMKGWHRHGVCAETHWPYRGTTTRLTPDAQIEALGRPLGAYFRVRHLHLNHMHAALNEVGILFASASVHEGWWDVDPSTGKIPFSSRKTGGHAFAIVGYDAEGFWIQNSWGPSWGLGGFCHIGYDDWLENGFDCWVARLGVPTTSVAMGGAAERLRVEDFNYIPHESVVLADIRPHFVNLGNNGELSATGRYSNDAEDVRAIFRDALPAAARNMGRTPRLLLYAHGGLNSEQASASRIASMKPYFLANGIYPLHFMWETGLKETLSGILKDAFSRKRFGGWGSKLKERFLDLIDEGIELGARPLGRPVWGEMKENAAFASKGSGGALLVAKEIKRYLSKAPLELHIVGHSAGSIFHGHLIPQLAKLGIKVKTVTLYAPACTTDLFKASYLPNLSRTVGSSVRGPAIERLTIFNLDDDVERDDRVGPVYNKSLLYLVSEAFEPKKQQPILGMERFLDDDDKVKRALKGMTRRSGPTTIRSNKKDPRVRLESKSTTHGGFDNDEGTLNSTLRLILGENPAKPFPKKRRTRTES